jgi:hypothetical protein
MIITEMLFQIRRLAIKELPSFCRDTKENTPKISDILAQLLNATDSMELTTVNLALSTLSKVSINTNSCFERKLM